MRHRGTYRNTEGRVKDNLKTVDGFAIRGFESHLLRPIQARKRLHSLMNGGVFFRRSGLLQVKCTAYCIMYPNHGAEFQRSYGLTPASRQSLRQSVKEGARCEFQVC
jgi:hypothetical protein